MLHSRAADDLLAPYSNRRHHCRPPQSQSSWYVLLPEQSTPGWVPQIELPSANPVPTPQAPIRSVKKQAVAKKPAASSAPQSGIFGDDFRTSKKDKRQIKHNSFMSKIEKNSQKSAKRRRSSKKLAANLDSLADALPEADDLNDPENQVKVIKQTTLRHKPGAMKRREKLEKAERDRFAKNMAQMSGIEANAAPNAGSEGDSNAGSNRWAALRSFISQTMEHQPAFNANK